MRAARVEALYPLAEIGERHALRVAVISLADTLYFGICADPDIVDGVADMATGIETEALAAAAHERPARSRRHSRARTAGRWILTAVPGVSG